MNRSRAALLLAPILLACSSTVALAGDQCYCPPDLNVDGVVDGADYGLVLAQWGTKGAADFNEDGTVDGADLGITLSWWGPCPPPPYDTCGTPYELGNSPSIGAAICNIGATDSATSIIDSCGNDGATPFYQDVWFTYSPPRDGTLVVSTCGDYTDFDTTLAVYASLLSDDCVCAGGQFATLVGCDDDTCGLKSSVTIPCVGGKCYTIRVGSFSEDVGVAVLLVQNNP